MLLELFPDPLACELYQNMSEPHPFRDRRESRTALHVLAEKFSKEVDCIYRALFESYIRHSVQILGGNYECHKSIEKQFTKVCERDK